MKTAIQQGLEQLQAEIDKWKPETQSAVPGALLRAKEIFKALLPTERQIIEDAYIEGMKFIPVHPEHYKSDATDYFNQTFNDKNETDAN